jgi:hypothetical protein
MKKVTELAAELAAPAIAEAGCELWDVEYVREAGTWYLRICTWISPAAAWTCWTAKGLPGGGAAAG